MADTVYHLIDSNTGEEVYASNAFKFLAEPTPEHRIHDEDLRERYGAPAVIDRVEAQADGSVNVYINGVEERTNSDGDDSDQAYRRS